MIFKQTYIKRPIFMFKKSATNHDTPKIKIKENQASRV